MQQCPPSFHTLAKRGMDHVPAIAGISVHPHGRIPVFSLTRGEIDDLIAYIETVD
jgi:hypothetical protein